MAFQLKNFNSCVLHFLSWWARQDLNLGPTDYESAALTAELRAPRELTH